jgi:hypothetical protein
MEKIIYKILQYAPLLSLKLPSLEFQIRFGIDYFCLLSQSPFLYEFEQRSQNTCKKALQTKTSSIILSQSVVLISHLFPVKNFLICNPYIF